LLWRCIKRRCWAIAELDTLTLQQDGLAFAEIDIDWAQIVLACQ
jgi:hypothetical protein